MVNYLIRVHLPDRPGALGAVASRIGSVGGDVISIDILQRQSGTWSTSSASAWPATTSSTSSGTRSSRSTGSPSSPCARSTGALPDRHTELLEVATDLFKQHSLRGSSRAPDRRVRRSLAATFAAVLDPDASQLVTCDGRAA